MESGREYKKVGFDWVEANATRLIDFSKQIWNYAELGLEEFRSFQVLADFLATEGFALEKDVAGIPTAFVASWGRGNPVIGINCEYDALPGLSQEPSARKEPVVTGPPGHGVAQLAGQRRLPFRARLEGDAPGGEGPDGLGGGSAPRR